MAEPSAGTKVYRYQDEDGTPVFVTSLDQVPKAHREGAELFVVDPARALKKKAGDKLQAEVKKLETEGVARAKALGAKGLDTAKSISTKVVETVPHADQLDPLSVGVGFGVAIVGGLMFRVLRSSVRVLVKVAVVVGVIALLAGGYLGALRKTAGLGGGGAVATPQQVLEDAKKAAAQANKRVIEQTRMLEKIEEGER